MKDLHERYPLDFGAVNNAGKTALDFARKFFGSGNKNLMIF